MGHGCSKLNTVYVDTSSGSDEICTIDNISDNIPSVNTTTITTQDVTQKTTNDRQNTIKHLRSVIYESHVINKISFFQKKIQQSKSTSLKSVNQISDESGDHPMHVVMVLSCAPNITASYNNINGNRLILPNPDQRISKSSDFAMNTNPDPNIANFINLEFCILTEFFSEGICFIITEIDTWKQVLTKRGYIIEQPIEYEINNNYEIKTCNKVADWVEDRSTLKYNIYTNNCIDYALYLAQKFNIDCKKLLDQFEWNILIKMRDIWKRKPRSRRASFGSLSKLRSESTSPGHGDKDTESTWYTI